MKEKESSDSLSELRRPGDANGDLGDRDVLLLRATSLASFARSLGEDGPFFAVLFALLVVVMVAVLVADSDSNDSL